jgi:hypothetical protein
MDGGASLTCVASLFWYYVSHRLHGRPDYVAPVVDVPAAFRYEDRDAKRYNAVVESVQDPVLMR